MSDGINWNGTLPPVTPGAPPPRRPSPVRYVWGLLIVLVFGIAVYPWLRPMLTRLDSCHPGGASTVIHVPLAVCLDPNVWSVIITYEPGKSSFGTGDKIYFDTFGSRTVLAPDEFRTLILRYGKQFATNQEELSVVKEWTTEIGGRSWHALEYTSETADFVDYYYSADGFGSAQLLFQAFKPDAARRDQLAGPVLQSVKFVEPTT